MEMLGAAGKPSGTETPFSLTEVGGDNAEGLISPYELEPAEVLVNVCGMIDWLELERGDRKATAELWLTEGYDDAIDRIDGSPTELKSMVRTKILEAKIVDWSIRFVLSR